MHGHSNNILGFAIGSIAGYTQYLGNIGLKMEIVKRMAEAGTTALVCGFLGIAGKECFRLLVAWIKKKPAQKQK